MDIWIFTEHGDDGSYSTAHLTRKGCLQSAVDTLIDVLNIPTDSQKEFDEWKSDDPYSEKENIPSPIGWRELDTEKLKDLYGILEEQTWENDYFDCGIQQVTLKP